MSINSRKLTVLATGLSKEVELAMSEFAVNKEITVHAIKYPFIKFGFEPVGKVITIEEIVGDTPLKQKIVDGKDVKKVTIEISDEESTITEDHLFVFSSKKKEGSECESILMVFRESVAHLSSKHMEVEE